MPILNRHGLVPLAGPEPVPLSDLPRLPGATAVIAPVETPVEAFRPYLARLDLIVLTVQAFGNGRGFSLARRLRQAGFQGGLRLSGPVIADQFGFALACGFDEIELPQEMLDRQPVAQWLAAAGLVSTTYSSGWTDGGIFAARRASREGRS
jgi:uncharacterized protein (DUF934 family)